MPRTAELWALGAVVLAVSPTAALGAEDGGSLYAGDIGQAVAAILIFLVLLWILGRYAWGPIVEQLQQREQRVEKTLDDAARREHEANRLLGEYEAQLERAETDAQKLVEQSRAQAARDRAELLEQARRKSEAQAAEAREAIEQARRETLEQLHHQTAQLAAEIAGQVIGTGLDDSTHRRLVDQSLQEIRKRSQEARR
jgi:F-type H+-transporting ATPase subunit b